MKSAMLLLVCLLPLLTSASPLHAVGADTPCWDATKQLKNVPGEFTPECDRAGRYAPRQCHGSVCFCVDPAGEQLTGADGDYKAAIGESAEQACYCARVEYENQQSGLVGNSVRCDVKGDYHHTQCKGSQCYCAHPVTGGKLLGEELSGHVAGYNELTARCSHAVAAVTTDETADAEQTEQTADAEHTDEDERTEEQTADAERTEEQADAEQTADTEQTINININAEQTVDAEHTADAEDEQTADAEQTEEQTADTEHTADTEQTHDAERTDEDEQDDEE